VSSALAVLALPANSASAGNLTIQTPKVTVHTPAPPKLNNATIAQYRNGAQYLMPRKLPGRAGFDPITLDRGVTSDRSLQQWEQGIGGTGDGAKGGRPKTTGVPPGAPGGRYRENTLTAVSQGSAVLSAQGHPGPYALIPNAIPYRGSVRSPRHHRGPS
jgi:hypothetical protein